MDENQLISDFELAKNLYKQLNGLSADMDIEDDDILFVKDCKPIKNELRNSVIVIDDSDEVNK